MSVVINGMEMPINCTHCPCSDDESRFCRVANEYIPMLGKPKFCPITEQPKAESRSVYRRLMEQGRQRWIPCSERLPENERRVLCTVQSGEHFCVVPCIYIQHTRRWFPEVYGNHDNVIAWMPLPEPYKGEPT